MTKNSQELKMHDQVWWHEKIDDNYYTGRIAKFHDHKTEGTIVTVYCESGGGFRTVPASILSTKKLRAPRGRPVEKAPQFNEFNEYIGAPDDL